MFVVLAVIGGVAFGAAGTAGANGAYDSIVSPDAHVACEYTINNQIGSQPTGWSAVWGWLNPFDGDVFGYVGDQRKSRFGINESRGPGWGVPPVGEVSGGSSRWGRWPSR